LSVTITVGTKPCRFSNFRTGSSAALVASALHQKIENPAFVVDRAPEVHLLATDPDHHLVEMPT
jgi:hypothetical protein